MNVIEITVRRRYFHGGKPGLKVGDKILPPTVTGTEQTHPGRRLDRAFVGDQRQLARLFAIMWTLNPARPGDGQIYEVQPSGPLVVDKSLGTMRAGLWQATSWECESATVTAVCESLPRNKLLASHPALAEIETLFIEVQKAKQSGEPVPDLVRQLWHEWFPSPRPAPSETVRLATTALARIRSAISDGQPPPRFAWRCWQLYDEPGVLCSYLDPGRFRRLTRWEGGTGWQRPAWCAFHNHAAPDDSPVCGRCGWRGESELDMLVWWLADFKKVRPSVIGRVELGGRMLRGDPAHEEIPGIVRAEQIRITGPLVVAPGCEASIAPLARRYGVEVLPSSAARFDRFWVRSVPADLRRPRTPGSAGPIHKGSGASVRV